MRKLNLVSIIAIFLVSISAAEAYYVSVSPNPANTNDNLVCSTDASSPYFYWYNTNNLNSVLSTSNTLQATSTTRYNTYRCLVKRYVGGQGLVVVGQDDRYISNAAPQITAFNLQNGTEGIAVNFNSAATDADNDALTYTWSFGDGTANGIGANVAHTYLQNSTYAVTLTVTDGQGGSATASGNVVIADTVPVVNFTWVPPTPVEGQQVNFTNLVTAYDQPVTYFWQFGDGQNSTVANATNIYAQNGTYTVNLTATDADGSIASMTQSITVLDTVPVANFTWNPATPNENQSVQFNDTSYAYDNVTAWFWQFGDGSTSALQNPAHTYLDNGTFGVNLTVTDSDGSIASMLQNVLVLNVAPAANASGPYNCIEGQNITLYGTGIDPSPIDQLSLFFSWAFNSSTIYNVIGQNVTYPCQQNGTYTNNLNVTDKDGGSGYSAANVVVNDTAPNANFAWVPAIPLVGQQANFTDLSTSYDAIVSWNWNFGDSFTSTLQNPTHSYAAFGLYPVNLTVTDNDGSVSSIVQTIFVNNTPGNVSVNYTVNLASLENSSLTSNIGTITFNLIGYGLPNSIIQPAGVYSLSFTPAAGYNFTNWTAVGGLTVANIFANPTTVTVIGNGTLTAIYYNITAAGNFTNSTNATNAAPIVSLIAPPNGANFTATNISLYYNVSDDLSATLNCTLYVNGVANATNYNVPNGALNFFNPLFNDGTYSWYVSCTDGTNTSQSQTWTFTVNTSAPAVHSVAISQTYTGSVYGIRINGTSGDILSDPANLTQGQGYSIRYRVDNFGTQAENVNIIVYSGSTQLANYVQSINLLHIGNVPVNASILALGAQNITVNATIVGFADLNPADNFATRQINVQPLTGNTAPVVNLIWPTNGLQINNTNTVGFNYTVVDGEQTTLLCSSYVDGSLASGPNAVANNTIATSTVSGISFGSHTWNVSCTDGFLTSWSTTWTFTLVNTTVADTIPPNIIFVNPTPANGSFQMYNWMYANATITDNVAVSAALLEFNNQNNSMSFIGPNNWYLNLTSIPDGSYSYKVWAVDTAGNWNVSETRYITINTTIQFNVINSFVNIVYYPLNISLQVPGNVINLASYVQNSNLTTLGANAVNNTFINNTNFTSSTAVMSSIIGSNITTSQIINSTLENCIVFNSLVNKTTGYGCNFTNSDVDPSNLTGTSTNYSTIIDSNVTYSYVDNSTIKYSNINGSVIINSNIQNSTVSNSNVTNSTLTNVTASNSTITNSTLVNVNVNNSTITNSNLTNITVNNGFVNNSQLVNGSVTCQGQTYTTNGTPLNLSYLCSFAPVAVISANPTSGNPTLTVLFEANSSYDPDGTIVSYYWDFGDGTNTTNISQFHSYGSAGTYNVMLTVTDNLGKNGTGTVSISVTNPSSGGSSGGGGGGGGSSGGSSFGGSSTTGPVITCRPDWECNNWGSCQSNGQQTRTCLDKNRCSSTAGRPPMYQACSYSAPQAAPVQTTTSAKAANGLVKITGSVTSAPKTSPLIGSAITAAIVVAGLLLFLAVRRK